jgi:hypothetical protein
MIRRAGFVAVASPTMNQTTYPGGSQDQPATESTATMALTDKQLKSINTHCDRVVRRRDEGKDPSLFIGVAESRIYDGKPLHKALLKEVIFMRMHDLHENDTRIPKNTPWSGNYKLNEGWCYASQGYLANRVGSKDPTYVCTVLGEIEKDGYLKSRSYKVPGAGFRRRKQYFALEEFIYQRIADLGMLEEEESDEKGSDKSDGASPLGNNQTPILDKPQPPIWINPTTSLDKPKPPIGINQRKYVRGSPLSSVSEYEVRVTPPKGEPVVAHAPKSKEPEATPKSKANPYGVGLKPETTPTPKPNRHKLADYLDNEPTPKRFGRMATFPDDPELDGVVQ